MAAMSSSFRHSRKRGGTGSGKRWSSSSRRRLRAYPLSLPSVSIPPSLQEIRASIVEKSKGEMSDLLSKSPSLPTSHLSSKISALLSDVDAYVSSLNSSLKDVDVERIKDSVSAIFSHFPSSSSLSSSTASYFSSFPSLSSLSSSLSLASFPYLDSTVDSIGVSLAGLENKLSDVLASSLSTLPPSITSHLDGGLDIDALLASPPFASLPFLSSLSHSSLMFLVVSSYGALKVLQLYILGSLFTRLRGKGGKGKAKQNALGSMEERRLYDGEELPGIYDTRAIDAYFRRRPVTVLIRLFQIALEANGVIRRIQSGRKGGVVNAEEEEQNAKEVVRVLTALGPTFIKAGQSASIRADILPPTYAIALRDLQDSLPPFPSEDAFSFLCKELGVSSVSDLFGSISPEPVAAASLGQVYRAILKSSGEDVAVKIQRPNVRETICLDLWLMRQIAPIVREKQGLNTDLVGLVDEWGQRFLAELEYKDEANSAENFNSAMRERGLDKSVFAPRVVREATSSRILTTEWIDGQRLDELSEKDDVDVENEVPRLCALALNTYLVMLLETGELHADPHPGNLLRDKADGRLCILDWGLVTPVDSGKQYALIDYISHLTNEEWNKVPADLVELGFVPPDKADIVMQKDDVTKVLGQSLRAITQGGGAQKVRSKLVLLGSELRDTQTKYGNLFQIPPYFAYILKTFNILEGISLGVDPDYSITAECYPYLAKRLFTDDNPRVHRALESLLFVPTKNGSSRQLNVKRLAKLTRAFQSFEDSAAGDNANASEGNRRLRGGSGENSLPVGTREAIQLIFSEKGSYLQKLLVEETARLIDVSGRSVIESLFSGIGSEGFLAAVETQKGALSSAGLPEELQRTVLLPFTALEVARETMSLDAEDKSTLETLREIRALFPADEEPYSGGLEAGSAKPLLEAFVEEPEKTMALVSETVPGILATAGKVGSTLARRIFVRAEEAASHVNNEQRVTDDDM